MAKTKKSVKKRFRTTKKGKLLRRVTGQSHFRSKKSGDRIRKGRKKVETSKEEAKKIKEIA